MSYRNQFTYSEWQTLQFAPLWVFSMVASVDGRLENKEVVALAKELAEAPLYRNPLAREVLISVGQNLAEVWPAYQRDSRNAVEGLHEVDMLLGQKVDDDETEDFKMAILGIGQEIIEKSAKGFFGPKDKTKEKAALVLAAIALGVRPD